MLDNVACVGDYTRNKYLALGNFDTLKQVIFVLVARIGRFEAVLARINFQYILNDVRQRRLVDAWTFVDPITCVEPDAIGRNTFQSGVDRLNVNFSATLFLRLVAIFLKENVRQKRIIDLHFPACKYSLWHYRA